MSQAALLRALVTERLSAAAQDIFLLFERTIAEYEQQLHRLRTQTGPGLDTGSEEEPHTAGDQLMTMRDEEPPHVKDDPEPCLKWEPLCPTVHPGPTPALSPASRPALSPADHPSPSTVLSPNVPPSPSTALSSILSHTVHLPAFRSSVSPSLSPAVCIKTEDEGDDEVLLRQRVDADRAGGGPGCSSYPPTQSLSDSEDHSSDEAARAGGAAPNAEYVVKPHCCPECGKRFLRKDHLQGHMIIHTGERPHRCTFCDKTFIRQNHLKTHLRNHTGERPYSCPFCSRGFTTKALLTPHLRIHTGDRPFRCTQCDKGFIQRSHLKAHVKTHSRDRTFTCLICRQVFYERGDLMVHSRSAHPE